MNIGFLAAYALIPTPLRVRRERGWDEGFLGLGAQEPPDDRR